MAALWHGPACHRSTSQSQQRFQLRMCAGPAAGSGKPGKQAPFSFSLPVPAATPALASATGPSQPSANLFSFGTNSAAASSAAAAAGAQPSGAAPSAASGPAAGAPKQAHALAATSGRSWCCAWSFLLEFHPCIVRVTLLNSFTCCTCFTLTSCRCRLAVSLWLANGITACIS